MKILKISLSILAFSLAAVSFAQLNTDLSLAYLAKDGLATFESLPAESAELEYEATLELEDWMTLPFEAGLLETELVLENWMTTSFAEESAEETMVVEDWMTTPFEISLQEESLEMEDWMNAPFFAIK